MADPKANGSAGDPVPQRRGPGREKGCAKPAGSGRPKGRRNKRTEEQIRKAEAGGETPLDFLLRVMRTTSNPWERRISAAVAAAPYVHARLQTLKITGDVKHTVSRAPMTREEFIAEHGVEVLDDDGRTVH